MKKILFLILMTMATAANAQYTASQLKDRIDDSVTDRTGAKSITAFNVGTRMKEIVDFANVAVSSGLTFLDTLRSGTIPTYFYIDSVEAYHLHFSDTAAMLAPYLRKIDSGSTGAKYITPTILNAWAGSTNITTVGTITTGTWHGSLVTGTYGGTGVNNGSNTLTLGGSVVFSGANTVTLISTGTTNLTLPAATGTLIYKTTTATADRLSRFTGDGVVANSVIRDDGTNIGIGTAPNASYKLLVSGAGSVTGNMTFGGNVFLASSQYIDFIGGGSMTMGGNSGTGAWAFNTSIAGGYFPSFQNAGTAYLEYKNAGSSFIRGNMTSFFFVLHSGLFGGTPVNGAFEYDGTDYWGVTAATRYVFPKTLTGSATLNFGNTVAGAASDLTITVTGAAAGDKVMLGVDAASIPANGSYTAWVSAANTVTVRYTNNDLVTAYDPASGTFKVSVIK